MGSVRFFEMRDARGRSNAPLAWTDDGLFTWLANTKGWHRAREIEGDFLVDQEYEYVEITPGRATEMVGTARPIDGRTVRWLLDMYRSQPPEDRRTSADLGLRDVTKKPTSDPLFVEKLRTSGGWVDVKRYASGRRSAAKVLASELRQGRKKKLQDVGPLEARVQDDAGGIVVQARRRTEQ